MKYDKTQHYILNNGMFILTDSGIIGISPDLSVWAEIEEGAVPLAKSSHAGPTFPQDRCERFTQEERAEIADFMIGLWTAFKEQP